MKDLLEPENSLGTTLEVEHTRPRTDLVLWGISMTETIDDESDYSVSE